LLGLLGIVIQDLNVLIGISCAAINVIGVGGNSCFAPLVAIGCVPVDLSL
ncbi:hypothetical protein MPER_06691, partial [Moniliophthora perniciosa FA553]